MAITKIQSESVNLADNFAFTGTVTGAGGANTPAFHATSNSQQVIANNTFTKLQFGNEVFDTNSNYDTSNYRFLPTTAGKYYFKAVARSVETTNFSTIWMQIHKNDSVISRVIQPHDDYSSAATSVTVSMNGSSDYLEVFFRHNKGSDLTLENQTYSCYSEGFKIIE